MLVLQFFRRFYQFRTIVVIVVVVVVVVVVAAEALADHTDGLIHQPIHREVTAGSVSLSEA